MVIDIYYFKPQFKYYHLKIDFMNAKWIENTAGIRTEIEINRRCFRQRDD